MNMQEYILFVLVSPVTHRITPWFNGRITKLENGVLVVGSPTDWLLSEFLLYELLKAEDFILIYSEDPVTICK